MYKRNLIILVLLLFALIPFFSLKNTIDIDKKELKEESKKNINPDWYEDFNYALVDNNIIILNAKNSLTKEYELPSSATIDNKKYITKLVNGGTFANTEVTDLKIDDGVIIDNQSGLFANSHITNLDMSNMDLSNRTNLSFLNGNSYTNLNLSGSNLSNVTSFNIDSDCFQDTNKIDFSNTNLESITKIELYSSKTKYLDFSNANLKNVTFSDYFIGSGTFENVTLHGAKLDSFTYSNRYLLYGLNIINLDLSSIHVPNLTSLTGNLSHSNTIKTINMSNIDAPKLIYFYSTFEEDTNLEEVKFDGFKSNVEEASNIFNNCPKMTKVSIEGFKGINNLVTPTMKEISIKDVDTIKKYTAEKCRSYNKNNCILEKLKIENVKKIEAMAFAEVPLLTDISIIGNPEIEQYAFYSKPKEYFGPWVGYTPINRITIYSSTSFMPKLQTFSLSYDNPNVLLYNWNKDNRYITDNKEHTVTYDYNYKNGKVTTKKFKAGDYVTEGAGREDYMFRGWNTEKDGSGKLYMPGDVIYVNRDLNLYAQWLKTIYDTAEHKSGWIGESVKWRVDSETSTAYIYPEGKSDGVMYDQISQDGSRLSVPQELCDVKKVVFEEGITYISKNLFVGCTGKEKVIFPSTLKKIGEGAFLINIEELEGLDFNKVEVEDGVFYDNSYYEPKNSGNVYWWVKHPKEHNLTIKANGGKYEDGSTTKQYNIKLGYISYQYDSSNKSYNSKKNNPIEIEIPTKTGYKFKNLNTKADGSGKTIDISDNEIVIDVPTDVELYAIYQKEPIKVTYSTGDIPFIKSEELYYGDHITSEKPEKEGYVFAEWNTERNGNGIGYYPNQVIKTTRDLKLYPIFRKTIELEEDNNYSYGGSYKMIQLEDGTKIKVFRSSHDYYSGDNKYYEVSKEYIMNFPEYIGIKNQEEAYKKLITYLTTITEYDEGGFFDTLYTPDNYYDFYHDMPIQLTQRIISPREFTSNNGNEMYNHELKFLYIYKFKDLISQKYKLRVFTNGTTIYVGVEPIKAKVTIKTYDEDTKKPLKGMVVGIYNKYGDVIDIITIEDKDYVREIPIGNDYIVKRLVLPEGYENKEEASFSITLDNLEEEVILTDKLKKNSTIKDIITNPKTIANTLVLLLIISTMFFSNIIINKKQIKKVD